MWCRSKRDIETIKLSKKALEESVGGPVYVPNEVEILGSQAIVVRRCCVCHAYQEASCRAPGREVSLVPVIPNSRSSGPVRLSSCHCLVSCAGQHHCHFCMCRQVCQKREVMEIPLETT